MAASESAKLRQLQSAMDCGDPVDRKELMQALVDAADRLDALEASNKRLRDGIAGPEQTEWGRQMAAGFNGYMSNPNVQTQHMDDGDVITMVNNAEEIAEEIMVRWRMRWVDGHAPVRRARKAQLPPPGTRDALPPPHEIVKPEKTSENVRAVLGVLGPEPATRRRPEAPPPAADSATDASVVGDPGRGGATKSKPSAPEPSKPEPAAKPAPPPAVAAAQAPPPAPPARPVPPATPPKPEPPRQRMEGED